MSVTTASGSPVRQYCSPKATPAMKKSAPQKRKPTATISCPVVAGQMLMPTRNPPTAASAPRRSTLRNAYEGTIAQVQTGAARTQIVLTTAGGRNIAASMAKASGVIGMRRMKVGDAAWAGFATESVILATFD